MIREGSRLLDAVEQTIAAHADDPLAALTAGLKRFLTIATTDPFVRLLLGDDGAGGLLPLLTTRAVPPRLGSHVTAPPDPPARTAAAVTRLLAASIERMLEALPT